MKKYIERDPRECGIICSTEPLPEEFNLLDFPYVVKQHRHSTTKYYPFRILSYPKWYAVESYSSNVKASFMFEAEILRKGKLVKYLLNWNECSKYNLFPSVEMESRPRKLKNLPRIFA